MTDIVKLILLSLSTCGFLSFLVLIYLESKKTNETIRKENQLVIQLMTAQKPAPSPVPRILPYQATMQLFNSYIDMTFKRLYTTEIMPQLTKAGNSTIKTLAPSDTTYQMLLQKIIIQSFVTMPMYLKRSVYYHFGIIKTDTDDINNVNSDSQEFINCGAYITSTAKGFLDTKLVNLAGRLETSESDPNAIFDEYDDYGKYIGAIAKNIKAKKISTPDGSEVTIDDTNMGELNS